MIRKLEQYSRNKNVEIHNIPWTENEDIKEIVLKVAGMKKIEIDKKDIDVAHRFKTREKALHNPIIVQFTTRSTMEDFIKWKKGDEPIMQKDIVANR